MSHANKTAQRQNGPLIFRFRNQGRLVVPRQQLDSFSPHRRRVLIPRLAAVAGRINLSDSRPTLLEIQVHAPVQVRPSVVPVTGHHRERVVFIVPTGYEEYVPVIEPHRLPKWKRTRSYNLVCERAAGKGNEYQMIGSYWGERIPLLASRRPHDQTLRDYWLSHAYVLREEFLEPDARFPSLDKDGYLAWLGSLSTP